MFPGDVLETLQLREWVAREVKSDDVEVVDGEVLTGVARRAKALLALFVPELEAGGGEVPGLERLRTLADFLDISLALVPGKAASARLGLPAGSSAAVYFEDGVPSVFDGDLVRAKPAARVFL